MRHFCIPSELKASRGQLSSGYPVATFTDGVFRYHGLPSTYFNTSANGPTGKKQHKQINKTAKNKNPSLCFLLPLVLLPCCKSKERKKAVEGNPAPELALSHLGNVRIRRKRLSLNVNLPYHRNTLWLLIWLLLWHLQVLTLLSISCFKTSIFLQNPEQE